MVHLLDVKRRNRKGTAMDLPVIIIAMFTLAISILIAGYLINEVGDEFMSDEVIGGVPHINETMTTASFIANTYFDYIFASFVIGLLITVLILSFLIDVHPAFVVAFIILLIILIIVSGIVANAYSDISEQAVFAGVQPNFPVMNFIMEKLPFVVLMFGILVTIVLYSKSGISRGGGYSGGGLV